MAASSKRIVSPKKTKNSEGYYRFNVDFKHFQHDSEHSDLLQESRLEIVTLLEKVFLTSRAIDTTSLWISKGKLVWWINIEVSIINYDGNIIDALFLAVLQWLKTIKLPQVRAKDESVVILTDKPWKNINVHHMPIPVTFYFIKDEDHVLIDPDAKEEKVWTCRNTIFMNVFGDIWGIHTLGALDLSFERLNACLTIAEEKAKELTKIMRDKLKNIEDFKLKSIVSDLENMNIEESVDENLEQKNKSSKDKFIKNIKDSIDADFDNEQLDDNLIVTTMKRQKIPKLGEESSKRGSTQIKNKKNVKFGYKKPKDEEMEDDEEEVVQKLNNPFAK